MQSANKQQVNTREEIEIVAQGQITYPINVKRTKRFEVMQKHSPENKQDTSTLSTHRTLIHASASEPGNDIQSINN